MNRQRSKETDEAAATPEKWARLTYARCMRLPGQRPHWAANRILLLNAHMWVLLSGAPFFSWACMYRTYYSTNLESYLFNFILIKGLWGSEKCLYERENNNLVQTKCSVHGKATSRQPSISLYRSILVTNAATMSPYIWSARKKKDPFIFVESHIACT
jgi:hypothetical protein